MGEGSEEGQAQIWGFELIKEGQMVTATLEKKSGKKADKEKQGELPGMPERDALGKAAMEYMAKCEMADAAKKEKKEAKAALVAAFREANKTSITVERTNLAYNHSEKDSIVVKKA